MRSAVVSRWEIAASVDLNRVLRQLPVTYAYILEYLLRESVDR